MNKTVLKILETIGKAFVIILGSSTILFLGFVIGITYQYQQDIREIKEPIYIHMQIIRDSSDSIIPIVTLNKS